MDCFKSFDSQNILIGLAGLKYTFFLRVCLEKDLAHISVKAVELKMTTR